MKITITLDTNNQAEVIEASNFLGTFLSVEGGVKKKTPVKQTETKVEAPKKENEGVDKGEPEKEPEEAPSVTLAELKNLAKAKADADGRDAVKQIIAKYGGKLSDVKAEDYEALAAELSVEG